ncbi:MAG: helix-turn-helix domain-containing protein [Spirochaetia bacterium]|nr:helix-turn-helix domain-containing protein [Spirochaetia bacterium]
MKKNKETTFSRMMKDKKRKEKFDEGYNKFLLSEFLTDAMEENHISVRKLAEKAKVSPTIIQNIRSGKTSNVTLKKLDDITSVLGYRLEFKKVS